MTTKNEDLEKFKFSAAPSVNQAVAAIVNIRQNKELIKILNNEQAGALRCKYVAFVAAGFTPGEAMTLLVEEQRKSTNNVRR